MTLSSALGRIRTWAAWLSAWAASIARSLFYPIAVLALVVLALEAGVWRHQETHHGPFAPDPFVAPDLAGRSASFPIAGIPWLTCCTELRSDSDQAQSDLRLWINGLEMGPPATHHGKIRRGEGSGFSHWGPYVIFSLPPGVENSSATRATITYSLRPISGVAPVLLLVAAFLGGFKYRKRLHALASRAAPYVGRSLFYPIAVLAFVALALEAGVWKEQETHHGPFAADPFVAPNVAGKSVGFPIVGIPWLTCCTELRSDSDQAQSDLRLWINDLEMGPPATHHGKIRRGEGSGFSHWGPYVIFSLPPGLENSSATLATITYPLRPKSGVAALLLLLAVILGGLKYPNRLHALIRAPGFLLLLLSYSLIFACFLYIASSIYAFLTGWALPTTALIRWSPAVEWLARCEPYLGHALLALAGLGVVAAWVASFLPDTITGTRAVRYDTLRLRRILGRYGFVIVTSLFVFQVSAMWAGVVRTGDPHGASIGGLLAFADAGGHLAGAHDQAKDGVWSAFASRRPLAAAFRSTVLFFAGYSTPIMLILQAALVSAALCFATAAVARWRGLWSAVTFLALNYMYVRAFTPTTLTESLGFFWALISVPLFVLSLRRRSLAHAGSAFAFTVVALFTRMGSMFTIPALMVWMVWNFATGTTQRLKALAIAAAILLGAFSANLAVQKLYATNAGGTGSNFSYTLCGLTIGTTWDGCLKRIIEAGGKHPGSEEAATKLMETMAWENFKKQPMVLVARLFDGAAEFLKELPDLLWRGYRSEVPEPSWVPRSLLGLLCLIGIIDVLRKRREHGELSFWFFVLASIVLSSAFVFYDDGKRVLASSIPLICLFVSLGAAGPRPQRESGPAASSVLVSRAQVGLAFALALFVLVPWLAHQLSPVERIAGGNLSSKPGEAIVFGGRRMSGLLVVPDGAELPSNIASVHMSDFEAIIAKSGVEDYQGLIHPEAPPLPFGFVFAPRLEKNAASDYQFIVPAEVLQRPDVAAWRFEVKEWQLKPNFPGYGYYFLYVTRAEPLRLP